LHTGSTAGPDEPYEHLARVGGALSSPVRIRLLDLLGQGERSVEELAAAAGVHVANTSAHLQVLRRCHLVGVRRARQRVFYRLADDEVARFLLALRELARGRSVELQRAVQDLVAGRDASEPVRRGELLDRIARREVVVIDVRPVEEHRCGHLPGAVSMPLAELPGRLAELRSAGEIVAYGRGPYCVLAPEAVALLRRRGLSARRLEDGLPEWRLAGLPVEVGRED
jgi:DNA-binding transcriptional ArsR family regulator/rhodanese-related sulfurtransferase